MNWKVVVPKPISQAIGGFQLSRPLTLRLLSALHAQVSRDYDDSRRYRTPGFEATYRYRIVLREADTAHVFSLAIDDSTAQGFLIVVAIRHDSKNES